MAISLGILTQHFQTNPYDDWGTIPAWGLSSERTLSGASSQLLEKAQEIWRAYHENY